MKAITIIMFLFCLGCATPPVRPDITQMTLDVMAGRGQSLEQINQTFADYDKAREEYEQTVTYKSIPYLVFPLLILGSAMGDIPCYKGRRCLPNKAVVNTIPTRGGWSTTTIKWYR